MLKILYHNTKQLRLNTVRYFAKQDNEKNNKFKFFTAIKPSGVTDESKLFTESTTPKGKFRKMRNLTYILMVGMAGTFTYVFHNADKYASFVNYEYPRLRNEEFWFYDAGRVLFHKLRMSIPLKIHFGNEEDIEEPKTEGTQLQETEPKVPGEQKKK